VEATRSQLHRLAEGLASFPPDRLADLAEACLQTGVALSDMRFVVLADCWRMLDEYWDSGGIQTADVAELDEMLGSLLPWVLNEPDPDAAKQLAQHLHEEMKLFVAAHPST